MGTNTTNYNLYKPTVGGDKNTWGDEAPGEGMNENMNLIDTALKANADAVALKFDKAGGQIDGVVFVNSAGEYCVELRNTAHSEVASSFIGIETATGDTTIKHTDNASVVAARVEPAGTTITAATAIVTREKGDNRYFKSDGSDTLGGQFKADAGGLFTPVADGEIRLSRSDVAQDHALGIASVGGVYRPVVRDVSGTVGVYSDPASDTNDQSTTIIVRAKGDRRYSQVADAGGVLVQCSTGNPQYAYGKISTSSKVPATTGQYQITFGSAAVRTNYMPQVTIQTSATGAAARLFAHVEHSTKTVNGFRIRVVDINGNAIEPADGHLSVIVHGVA